MIHIQKKYSVIVMPKKKAKSPSHKKKKQSLMSYRQFFIQFWDKLLFIALFILFFIFIPGLNVYTNKGLITFSDTLDKEVFIIPTPAFYPKNISGYYPDDVLSAGGVVVLDVDSGTVLYERNMDMQFSPASTTKVLTALVALDYYNLDDVLTVKTLVNNGQDMGLVAGERITVENLLYGALIQSGNDAAYTIAENYPGGVEAFVEEMNNKAIVLQLTSSNFTNPMGYDNEHHKMTPRDLALLARIALKNPVVSKMVSIPDITISDVTHTYFHNLSNVNQLLGKIPGVAGIKTGWTEEAGENLVTLVERKNHGVIIVIMKSEDRFGETALLIDWVFDNYEWIDLKPEG